MLDSSRYDVVIVGAGLAGSQAALTCARHGLRVVLYEMRPTQCSPAHHTDNAAELVCSNSLKSDVCINASGLLKRELALMGCELLDSARFSSVPAGGALAVDRAKFSASVEEKLSQCKLIDLVREEVTSIDELGLDVPIIIAAGPLCSEKLSDSLTPFLGTDLHFYDAAAPIVSAESLNRERVFAASRYGKGQGDDYLNIALNEEEYRVFYDALVSAERVIKKDFEKKDLFNACQPVEEIARKGFDALRFGVMKPVGIDDPRTGRWPFALVQLRAETRSCASYNLVGFQTNLTWPDQKRVFSLLPGLEHAEFERLGVMHRNTFMDAPRVQDISLALREQPQLFFAGQITGTEGYTEAIASGLLCALNVVAYLKGEDPLVLPAETAFGSLMNYAHDKATSDYQPMHVNYGIMEPLDIKVRNKRDRYKHYALRSIKALDALLAQREPSLMFAKNREETAEQIIDEIVHFQTQK